MRGLRKAASLPYHRRYYDRNHEPASSDRMARDRLVCSQRHQHCFARVAWQAGKSGARLVLGALRFRVMHLLISLCASWIRSVRADIVMARANRLAWRRGVSVDITE